MTYEELLKRMIYDFLDKKEKAHVYSALEEEYYPYILSQSGVRKNAYLLRAKTQKVIIRAIQDWRIKNPNRKNVGWLDNPQLHDPVEVPQAHPVNLGQIFVQAQNAVHDHDIELGEEGEDDF